MFTTASNGPTEPLYPEKLLSKTSSYSARIWLNAVQLSSGKIESGSSWTEMECGGGDKGETVKGLETGGGGLHQDLGCR